MKYSNKITNNVDWKWCYNDWTLIERQRHQIHYHYMSIVLCLQMIRTIVGYTRNYFIWKLDNTEVLLNVIKICLKEYDTNLPQKNITITLERKLFMVDKVENCVNGDKPKIPQEKTHAPIITGNRIRKSNGFNDEKCDQNNGILLKAY